MSLFIIAALLVFLLWAIDRFYIRGGTPDEYPAPDDPNALQTFTREHGPGPESTVVANNVTAMVTEISSALHNKQLTVARTAFDSISHGRDYASQFIPVDAGGVPAEWVIAPGADSQRRVLYIHGGGFVMGSPKSHRTMTSKFSEVTGSAVLAIDYRLLPKFKHMDCVEDCRTAYQWILNNGPNGPETVRQLFFGGDSAGGNLALSLVAWVRDNGLRAPDAVVAFSPLTDCTFSSASLHENEVTDIMLAPLLKLLVRLPHFARSWWVVWTHRVRPTDPVASPLLGDLTGLPPILVQASEAEMLLDDARRYVYKACAAGTPAKLQSWPDMVHIWQIFAPELPQANEAWLEIGKFIETQTPA